MLTETDIPLTADQWAEIARLLREPFDPAEVDFRPQGKPEANKSVQMVCYIDARLVMERWDAAVGPGNWSFDWQPLAFMKEKGKDEVAISKGTLTIHGTSRSDVGEASSFSPSKGCVSDALKRAAVHWGVGRYLYDVEKVWVRADANGHIPDAEIRKLRAKLPQPGRQREHESSAVEPEQQQQEEQNEASTTDASVLELSKKRAPRDQQADLVKRLRDGGMGTVNSAEAWLQETVGRVIRIDPLKRGDSNITIGEMKKCIEALDAHTQQRPQQRTQQHQPA